MDISDRHAHLLYKGVSELIDHVRKKHKIPDDKELSCPIMALLEDVIIDIEENDLENHEWEEVT